MVGEMVSTLVGDCVGDSVGDDAYVTAAQSARWFWSTDP